MKFQDMAAKINRDIVSRLLEGEYYIVDSKNHILHSLNETGTFIFEQLKKNNSISDIVKSVCSEFEVDENEAEKDFHEFIETLKDKKILVVDEK